MGREIENYVPQSVLNNVTGFELNPVDQFCRVVKSRNFDKVKFAEKVVRLWGDEWPFDLQEKCADLVQRIVNAR